jgi:hypothetical protein
LCQHFPMVTRFTTNQRTWKHLRPCKLNGITQWNPRPIVAKCFILKDLLKDLEHWRHRRRRKSDELYLEWKLWWQEALVWRNLLDALNLKPLLNIGDIKLLTLAITSDLNVDSGSNDYILWWQWTLAEYCNIMIISMAPLANATNMIWLIMNVFLIVFACTYWE